MALESGQALMHYRLVEEIGAGGMGVVWKALDTTLEREVAIKVLPESLGADGDRLRRFEREARLLATLNHPNIATVHGLHTVDGVPFLAMELVPGEDLSRRIARGAIPVEEALGLASQVAEALEAAHENGVIHRDLKPANIQLTPEGRVKVLDFGLAKAFEDDPDPSSTPSMSPTVTSAGTQVGVILGTAAYMSPEQAKGLSVDKRTDIWAFGCVLLEMLRGRRAFHGDSIAETLASVLKESPELDDLPADVPPHVERLLRRCLVKDPRQRLRDIGDARIALGETGEPAEEEIVTARPKAARTPAWLRLLPWGLAAALALGWLGLGLRDENTSTPTTPASRARLSAIFPEDEPMYLANLDLELMPAFALSPDGSRVVVTTREKDVPQVRGAPARKLQMRRLEDGTIESIVGTESVELPFFSPDGKWIGFFDGETLGKIPAAGGARVTLASGVGNGVGGSWGEDGAIVYSHSYVGPLWTMSEDGGIPVELTVLAEGERSHRFPHVLPGGRWVLFTIKSVGMRTFDEAKIAIADRSTGAHRVLLEGGTQARYSRSGHMVYARDGALLAAPFDLQRGEITGAAVPVLEGVVTNTVTGASLYDIADNGTLAYVPGSYSGPTRLISCEQDGSDRTLLGGDVYAVLPRISPDGTRVLLHGSSANDEILMLDIARDTIARMTEPTANNILPIWDARGERIYFASDRSGSDEVVSMPAEGGTIETLIAARGFPIAPSAFSTDGRLLTINHGQRSSLSIWIFDMAAGEMSPFLDTGFDERDAIFSPEGDWIVYSSDESGQIEIYARPYPGPGGKVQLSTGGGSVPRLRADGAELYYLVDDRIAAVQLTWNPAPRPGAPRTLFRSETGVPINFDVTRDGKRFFVIELDETEWESRRLDFALGWFETLRERASN